MISTSEIKVGSAFMFEGEPLIVQKMLGQKSGRAGRVTQLRVKNIVTGGTKDVGLDAGEKFDDVDLDEKTVQLSYIDGDEFAFMDQETYEEVRLSREDLGDNAGYITPEDEFEIKLTFYEGKPVNVNLPINVTRTVVSSEPGVKGNTSGKTVKPATLDTGLTISVPLFINEGEKVVIDTRDGSFVERAK